MATRWSATPIKDEKERLEFQYRHGACSRLQHQPIFALCAPERQQQLKDTIDSTLAGRLHPRGAFSSRQLCELAGIEYHDIDSDPDTNIEDFYEQHHDDGNPVEPIDEPIDYDAEWGRRRSALAAATRAAAVPRLERPQSIMDVDILLRQRGVPIVFYGENEIDRFNRCMNGCSPPRSPLKRQGGPVIETIISQESTDSRATTSSERALYNQDDDDVRKELADLEQLVKENAEVSELAMDDGDKDDDSPRPRDRRPPNSDV